MACHESTQDNSIPCVGWVNQQLGIGNNIRLRLAVMSGRISGRGKLDGEQHETLEDTLPQKQVGCKT